MSEFANKGYSDADAVAATDGVIDADTVDGQQAADLGAPTSTQAYASSPGYNEVYSGVTSGTDITGIDIPCDEVRFIRNSGYGTADVHLSDRSTLDTGNMDSGTYHNVTFPWGLVESITWVTNQGDFDIQFHRLGVEAHSHNI